jgi:hypothetical protein
MSLELFSVSAGKQYQMQEGWWEKRRWRFSMMRRKRCDLPLPLGAATVTRQGSWKPS